jgi:hypothetical protein
MVWYIKMRDCRMARACRTAAPDQWDTQRKEAATERYKTFWAMRSLFPLGAGL